MMKIWQESACCCLLLTCGWNSTYDHWNSDGERLERKSVFNVEILGTLEILGKLEFSDTGISIREILDTADSRNTRAYEISIQCRRQRPKFWMFKMYLKMIYVVNQLKKVHALRKWRWNTQMNNESNFVWEEWEWETWWTSIKKLVLETLQNLI